MRLLDYYPLPPGVCRICNLSHTPVVDTGRTTDFDGVTYVCADCIRALGQLIELQPLSLTEELRNRAEVAETRVRTLESELADVTADYVAVVDAYDLVKRTQTRKRTKASA